MGFLVLEGGAEFGGEMAQPDRRALTLAGGNTARVCIIPTAAAPDKNHQRAGANGVRWFQRLGARNVAALPVIDRLSADNSQLAAELKEADLIFLLGGFPRFLGQTLAGSKCWQAIWAAWRSGAVLAGSSAGAMVLCEHYYDPESGRVVDGFNLVPNACVLPHHNSFGKQWAPKLIPHLPDSVLIGIDEATGIINDGGSGHWQVYGAGHTILYRRNKIHRFGLGDRFVLDRTDDRTSSP